MWGHLGLYGDAVRERKANLAKPGVSEAQSLEWRIDIAGARFIYGQHLRGWWSLWRVEKSITAALSLTPETKKGLQTKALETRLMMYMRMAQILHLVRCEWLLTPLEKKIGKRYEDARRHLEEEGEWGRLEALQINAERIGIARQEGLPFPSREGYRALGMISMEVIAVRDRIRSSHGRLTRKEEWVANCCLRRAVQYGWHHEAWKFHWILLWRGHRAKKRHLMGWWNEFWEVQYAPLARILHLAVNLVPLRKEV